MANHRKSGKASRGKSDKATHDLLSGHQSFSQTNRVKVTKASKNGYGDHHEAGIVTVRSMSPDQIAAMRAKAPEVRKRAILGINQGALFV